MKLDSAICAPFPKIPIFQISNKVWFPKTMRVHLWLIYTQQSLESMLHVAQQICPAYF